MTQANTATQEPGSVAGPSSSAQPSNGETAAPAASNVERAEVLADRFAGQVSAVTSVVGRKLLRFMARVREEATDVWAEAQNIRKGEKS